MKNTILLLTAVLSGPAIPLSSEYGFEIIGCVMLWHLIEVLGFTPLAIRSRINALQTLPAVDGVIPADQTQKLT